MRQPFKDKFLSDLDGDGCPIPNPLPFGPINIGKLPDVDMAQALLADARCLRCPPAEQCSRSGTCEHRNSPNPPGWDEVDGVKLAPIVWAAEQAALANHDGITRLSDSYAPDAFYGWKR